MSKQGKDSGITGIMRIRKWIANELEERDRHWEVLVCSEERKGTLRDLDEQEFIEFCRSAYQEENLHG